jgi:hypothetical protein
MFALTTAHETPGTLASRPTWQRRTASPRHGGQTPERVRRVRILRRTVKVARSSARGRKPAAPHSEQLGHLAPGGNSMKLVRISLALALYAASSACSSKKSAPEAPAAVKLVSALPASISNGAPLEPAPAVHLVDASGSPTRRRSVPVSVAVSGGDATLRGTLSATRTMGCRQVSRALARGARRASRPGVLLPGLAPADSALQLTPVSPPPLRRRRVQTRPHQS